MVVGGISSPILGRKDTNPVYIDHEVEEIRVHGAFESEDSDILIPIVNVQNVQPRNNKRLKKDDADKDSVYSWSETHRSDVPAKGTT